MAAQPVKIKAEVSIALRYLERLKNYTVELAEEALDEVTKEALEVAKDHSRVDTGAMREGWERTGEGFGSTEQKLMIEISNQTENSYGETYTPFHERGTKYIDPQPMLSPAMQYVKDNLAQAIADKLTGTRGYKSINKSIVNGDVVTGPLDT